MHKEVYTIAIMTFSGKPIRIFSISLNNLIITSIMIFCLIISSITFVSLKAWKVYNTQVNANADIAQKYNSLQKDFLKLQEELSAIRKTYQSFKTIIGIETDDSSTVMLYNESDLDELSGEGGPDESDLEGLNMLSPEMIANSLETDISSAIKEAVSLKYDLENLTESLSSKIDKLARIPSLCPIWIGSGDTYRISSGFGLRISPFTGLLENHYGLDIAAPLGTPILATADGIVCGCGTDQYLGNYVLIRHNERFSTLYGHMSQIAYGINIGREVKRYDTIGYVGNTGRSTGYHIHYEVRDNGIRVNPLDYILN